MRSTQEPRRCTPPRRRERCRARAPSRASWPARGRRWRGPGPAKCAAPARLRPRPRLPRTPCVLLCQARHASWQPAVDDRKHLLSRDGRPHRRWIRWEAALFRAGGVKSGVGIARGCRDRDRSASRSAAIHLRVHTEYSLGLQDPRPRAAGVKPIVARPTPSTIAMPPPPPGSRERPTHLTLLAASDAGFLEGFGRGKPSVGLELLDCHSGDVLVL